MNHPDARLLPRERKPLDVGRHEVDEQHAPDEVAARENWNPQLGKVRPPINEKTSKKLVLRFVQTQVHLRERAPKNKHDPYHQAGNGQPQRSEKTNDSLNG